MICSGSDTGMRQIIISMKNEAWDRKSRMGPGSAPACCRGDAAVPKGTDEHPSRHRAWGWHGDIHHSKGVARAPTEHAAMAGAAGCSYLGKFMLRGVKACFPRGRCGQFGGNSCACNCPAQGSPSRGAPASASSHGLHLSFCYKTP